MNDFKEYKKINGRQINVKIIYEDYPTIDGITNPPFLRAAISGLDESIVETENGACSRGYKFITLSRDKGMFELDLDDATAVVEEFRQAGEEFKSCNKVQECRSKAIIYLLNEIDKYLKEIK
ncbi:hypothetical protein HOG48_00370 [Candidatus Peregrinibacteria bacterium]|jgi:hypothetical protein|nr:hypothetical protein [Candidatus Peregrinibacteria bacterium]